MEKQVSSTALMVQGIHEQSKMASEEIHYLEEIRHIATAVGQRKWHMDQVGECKRQTCHMEQP